MVDHDNNTFIALRVFLTWLHVAKFFFITIEITYHQRLLWSLSLLVLLSQTVDSFFLRMNQIEFSYS